MSLPETWQLSKMKIFFLCFLTLVSVQVSIAAESKRIMKTELNVDAEYEIRAVVFGDLAKAAQKTINQKETFVLAVGASDADYIYSRLDHIKPLVLCFVHVTVDSEQTASAEGTFQFSELGAQMFRYRLSKGKEGWSIVSRTRVGGG
jgi:hypothetical protein